MINSEKLQGLGLYKATSIQSAVKWIASEYWDGMDKQLWRRVPDGGGNIL
jgi:hypothetical protein